MKKKELIAKLEEILELVEMDTYDRLDGLELLETLIMDLKSERKVREIHIPKEPASRSDKEIENAVLSVRDEV